MPRDVYEKLWQEAIAAFDGGFPRLDPFLKNQTEDPRRGITLVGRPDSEVCDRISKFLLELAEHAPGQYYYQPAQIHLTIFSVIPGSEFWRQRFEQLPARVAVLDQVLKKQPAFEIAFRGVTASPEAVMVQGFPGGNVLAQLRDDLRAAFFACGLGENLDVRYKISAAHLTVARFQNTLPDWKPLKALLATNRDADFGAMRVKKLQLIEGDWYASPDSVKILRDYPLS